MDNGQKKGTIGKEKHLIFIIADEYKWTSFYYEQMQGLGYDLITASEEWASNSELWNDERVKGHNGPLCGGFIEALIEKVGANKYDGIVIDQLCEDLIGPLKKSGYTGPIIMIGEPPHVGRTNCKYVKIPSINFKENLQETLANCLK